MRHALCPCVWIDILSILRCGGAGRHGRHRDTIGWTTGVVITVGCSRVRIWTASINTQRAANRIRFDLWMGRELRRGSGDGRGLLALLLLVHCLVGTLL